MVQRRNGSRGLTLLEMMVVAAMAALATAMATLALPRSEQRQLELELQRLAAWLEHGRAQSRASGQVVSLEVAGQGFRLVSAGNRQTGTPQWQPWKADGLDVVPQRVLLGPEPIIEPQRLIIGLQGLKASLATDGVRPFQVYWQQ